MIEGLPLKAVEKTPELMLRMLYVPNQPRAVQKHVVQSALAAGRLAPSWHAIAEEWLASE